jgi:hypothetical protein
MSAERPTTTYVSVFDYDLGRRVWATHDAATGEFRYVGDNGPGPIEETA